MKKQTVIELSEKELAKVLAEYFDLDVDSATVSIYKSSDSVDPREAYDTSITLKANSK